MISVRHRQNTIPDTTMKDSRSTPLDDIREALGTSLEMSDSEAGDFLARYDAGEIEVPDIPPHLLPAPLARSIASEHSPETTIPADSLDGLAVAARSGKEALSEETIRRMMDAQKGEDES